jgi:hypothetical protein
MVGMRSTASLIIAFIMGCSVTLLAVRKDRCDDRHRAHPQVLPVRKDRRRRIDSKRSLVTLLGAN